MRKIFDEKFRIKDLNSYDRVFKPDFYFLGESHSVWEVVFVHSGSIEVTEDAKIYSLSAGDMIIHAPMEFHRIRSAENTSPRVINWSFNLDGELPQMLSDGVFSLDAKEIQNFLDISKDIHTFICTDTCDAYVQQEIRESMSLFLLRLSKSKNSKKELSHSQGAIHYHLIAESMQEAVYENLSLENFAKKNHVSVSYIHALFKRYTGISAKQYYINLRTAEAGNLLLQGLSVNETSRKMNFSSPNYFSLFFKKQTGFTPSQYVKKRSVH